MATNILTTDDVDSNDFGCRAGKLGINWNNLDCDAVGGCLDAAATAGAGDPTHDAACALQASCLDAAATAGAGDPTHDAVCDIVTDCVTNANTAGAGNALYDEICDIAGDCATGGSGISDLGPFVDGASSAEDQFEAAAVAAGDGIYCATIDGCKVLTHVCGGSVIKDKNKSTNDELFSLIFNSTAGGAYDIANFAAIDLCSDTSAQLRLSANGPTNSGFRLTYADGTNVGFVSTGPQGAGNVTDSINFSLNQGTTFNVVPVGAPISMSVHLLDIS